MTDHRLLTVRQPWATPIVDGLKVVENRGPRFGLDYRGPLWIHAGAAWDPDGLKSPLVFDHYLRGSLFTNYRDAGFALGVVLGVVLVVDAHLSAPGCCPGNPWAVRDEGTTHLVFEEAVKVRGPVVAGALGLWRAGRIPGLSETLDRLLEETRDDRDLPVVLDEFAGVYASRWPDLCSHPSTSGDRCDTCRADVPSYLEEVL